MVNMLTHYVKHPIQLIDDITKRFYHLVNLLIDYLIHLIFLMNTFEKEMMVNILMNYPINQSVLYNEEVNVDLM